jgi:hypothetical protein
MSFGFLKNANYWENRADSRGRGTIRLQETYHRELAKIHFVKIAISLLKRVLDGTESDQYPIKVQIEQFLSTIEEKKTDLSTDLSTEKSVS